MRFKMDFSNYLSETSMDIFWLMIGVVVVLFGLDHLLSANSAFVADLLRDLASFLSFQIPEIVVNIASFTAGVPVSLAGISLIAKYGNRLV